MPRYIGEYDCKVDAKGRVVVPAGLKKQIPKEAGGEMVINRGFDKCLTLFTRADWDKEVEKLDGLSTFNKKERQFMRLFNSGATEVSIDNAGRILIPQRLMEYAEIESDAVFYAWGNKIEIWSKKHHDEQMAIDADEFSDLAEEVMSKPKRTTMTSGYHQPVMLAECLEALQIKPDGIYADVTFGGGGHSREILKQLQNGKLIGFDQDTDALQNVPDDERFEFVHHNYRFIKNFLKFQNNYPIDGILADLGISSHQIDEESRGFSYRYDAPLDMRMSVGAKLTASDVLNTYDEKALDFVFRHYGELPKSWQMSKAIVRHRVAQPIATTWQLKEVLQAFVPAKSDFRFWSQVFQALRIEVNAELESLKVFLRKSAEVLKPGGRLVVLTYHSLEDRLVKHYIQKGSFEGEEELEADIYGAKKLPFTAVNKKPIEPTANEIEANPRARSAKLRIAEKN